MIEKSIDHFVHFKLFNKKNNVNNITLCPTDKLVPDQN